MGGVGVKNGGFRQWHKPRAKTAFEGAVCDKKVRLRGLGDPKAGNAFYVRLHQYKMGRMLGFEPPRTTRAQILPVVGDWGNGWGGWCFVSDAIT